MDSFWRGSKENSDSEWIPCSLLFELLDCSRDKRSRGKIFLVVEVMELEWVVRRIKVKDDDDVFRLSPELRMVLSLSLSLLSDCADRKIG